MKCKISTSHDIDAKYVNWVTSVIDPIAEDIVLNESAQYKIRAVDEIHILNLAPSTAVVPIGKKDHDTKQWNDGPSISSTTSFNIGSLLELSTFHGRWLLIITKD
jgi:hypothetical protein